MTRRELAKFLTLGSGLLAGVNLLIAFIGLTGERARRTRPDRRVGGRRAAGRLAAVPLSDRRRPVHPGARTWRGRFDAFSQVCTHLSCAVVHRPGERALACPCHNGAFSAADGRPMAGPPTRRLPRIVIEQRGDELVAAGIEV